MAPENGAANPSRRNAGGPSRRYRQRDDHRLGKGNGMAELARPSDAALLATAMDQMARDAAIIAEYRDAMFKAHEILGTLSMGTEGQLRKQICTVYNILGKPLGRGRSSHGDPDQE